MPVHHTVIRDHPELVAATEEKFRLTWLLTARHLQRMGPLRNQDVHHRTLVLAGGTGGELLGYVRVDAGGRERLVGPLGTRQVPVTLATEHLVQVLDTSVHNHVVLERATPYRLVDSLDRVCRLDVGEV